MNVIQRISIHRYQDGAFIEKDDVVVSEATIRIVFNGEEKARLQALPQDIEELGVGYLVSEGIMDPRGLRKVDAEDNTVRVIGKPRDAADLPGIGSSGIPDTARMDEEGVRKIRGYMPSPEIILKLISHLFENTRIHDMTGATHAALYADRGGHVLKTVEDIGRHNAVDRIVGWLTLQGRNPCEGVLVVSGRLSMGMVLKTLRAGICTVISKSAPTFQAVHLARRYGLILIGFARGRSFNVYSGYGYPSSSRTPV